ncbi:MAG: hypothetical protein DMG97_16265 [Acidobacteria bacterium]|nr:MAG: hypothetical protein DMG97_16265 [Acidobacteriota bacterium]PYV75595.1 MAG: hypothetical protein DMG96_16675 [Acidobacteriota bacterium]
MPSYAREGEGEAVAVPTDDHGRMRADAIPPLTERTIICIQAGNVSTGAFDPATEICARAHDAGSWVHVDGAFGLWAAVAPARKHLLAGFREADSWATDGHKWLNVPYDSGIALVREPKHVFNALAVDASYYQLTAAREPCHYTPELSRRARGVEIWAAIRSLGRAGIADLIERNCQQAAYVSERLRHEGYRVLNDVILNQVLVSFGDAETTRRVIAAIQADGTCWAGGTTWHGQAAMRICFSSWATTQSDVEMSVDAILRAAKRESERANESPNGNRKPQ